MYMTKKMFYGIGRIATAVFEAEGTMHICTCTETFIGQNF